MTSKRLALAAAVLFLAGCPGPRSGPGEHTVNPNLPKSTAEGAARASADPNAFRQVITGRVLLAPRQAAYTVQKVTQSPVTGAEVAIGEFETPLAVFAQKAVTDAEGRFRVGHDVIGSPLFLRATATVGDQTVTMYAPVPLTSEREVTVDIDIVNAMLAQHMFERIRDDKSAVIFLDPQNLAGLRAEADRILTDQNAPDPRLPSEIAARLDLLLKPKSALSVLDEQWGQLEPQSPLPSPVTVFPASYAPGPAISDRPIDPGADYPVGPAGDAKPAYYLSAAFTGVKRARHLAVGALETHQQPFMAAVDTQSNSLFAFFNEVGRPALLSAAELQLTTVRDVAVDGLTSAYVVGPNKLVRLQMTPQTDGAPKVEKRDVLADSAALAQAQAVAVSLDGASAYVAGSDGRIRKYALPAGTPVASFAPQLAGPVEALAVAPDGNVFALWGTQGAIAAITPAGAVISASQLGVEGATSLVFNAAGHLFVGTQDRYVVRFKPGSASETLLQAHEPIVGVGALGTGYLYYSLASGAIEVLNVVRR